VWAHITVSSSSTWNHTGSWSVGFAVVRLATGEVRSILAVPDSEQRGAVDLPAIRGRDKRRIIGLNSARLYHVSPRSEKLGGAIAKEWES